ncbi:DUF1501 domain-containing protein [Corallococcus aberystwythensis]|uniref:DUF1501 domain-containing protein n=1 Tax=Corallococcus aberystwythensis TaxID=2316722 RepID=A0A3A8R0A4_9BACT|nr:DUF1501 domain-containing protein [Corallococcus aberystwythensis]RKH74476.1 DUF1501 domain-containing protein [Corallococcus aberystwythensis]
MKLSRRNLFQAAFGAAHAGLLARYGLPSAMAQSASGRPTKMLAIWLVGGLHWESFFAPMTRAGIQKFIPPAQGGNYAYGYNPEQVEHLDRSPVDLMSPGPARKLRVPVYWNWSNPADRNGNNPVVGNAQVYRPEGYVWANPAYKLYEKAVLLVGADQGTAAHASGLIASMSGVAGSTFRAPSVQAVVANAMASRFPDRPLPNVALGGPLPMALGLPALANPTLLSSSASVEPTLSDRRDGTWYGLRARKDEPDLAFDGTPMSGTVPATAVDSALLKAVRRERGTSSAGTDGYLEQLYDTYKGASRTIRRDMLSVLEKTPAWEKLKADPAYPEDWMACTGYADACGTMPSMGDYAFALQLLKSDLVSTVNLRATSIEGFTFDSHFVNGQIVHAQYLRIAMEMVGRMCLEMSLTPSRSDPSRSLLDETLVYVYSDFGRTFPKVGSDHHPATCALLVGGGIQGNQMIGGYDERMDGSPMGIPVRLVEESGDIATRTPTSQDVAATVLRAYGLVPGKDFFIPGGYGVFDGVVRS